MRAAAGYKVKTDGVGLRKILLLSLSLSLLPALPAAGEPVYHLAENQVPVAIVEVIRTQGYTELHLRALTTLQGVCWFHSGADSPYLLSGGQRYRFQGGAVITACPTLRDYAAGEVMVLRFDPLGLGAREFSLVEGEGGENQMIDPSSSTTRYWNFLRVRVN